jgi:hypothetical protein
MFLPSEEHYENWKQTAEQDIAKVSTPVATEFGKVCGSRLWVAARPSDYVSQH